MAAIQLLLPGKGLHAIYRSVPSRHIERVMQGAIMRHFSP
jgi:hypothetical protein